MPSVSPHQLKNILGSDAEIAVLDVRERNVFIKEHLLRSSCVPLSRLEFMVSDLVPRLAAKIVVVGEGSSDPHHLDTRAAGRLRELGYTDVSILEGGIPAWRDAGFELFSGHNAYGKAFGEWIEKRCNVPHITPWQLHERMTNHARQILLDCRPTSEYHRMTIPGSVNAPGVDLVARLYEAVSDPSTMIVVHCAGRTRGILGTQLLVTIDIPNPVVALEHGTMGWELAGFDLEYGQTRMAPPPSPEGLARMRERVVRVAERFGVRRISYDDLAKWMTEASDRTLYVIDVRLPDEFGAGHLEGSRNVEGGQLIQGIDEYISVSNARIVLLDDTEVRATMTAVLLRQMGWSDVYVLADGIANLPLTQAPYQTPVHRGVTGPGVEPGELRDLLDALKARVTVLDVASSKYHVERHIPGAHWGIRARIPVELSKLSRTDILVLTSEDGTLAHLTAKDLKDAGFTGKVLVLHGGTAAWERAGFPTAKGMEHPISEVDDEYIMPYMYPNCPDEAKHEYFDWEHGLAAQLERDGTAKFRTFP